MYRRYYSYNDMPRVVQKSECQKPQKCESLPEKPQQKKGIELDDIILGIVILAILMDDGNDYALLIALAVIFLTGNI